VSGCIRARERQHMLVRHDCILTTQCIYTRLFIAQLYSMTCEYRLWTSENSAFHSHKTKQRINSPHALLDRYV